MTDLGAGAVDSHRNRKMARLYRKEALKGPLARPLLQTIPDCQTKSYK